MKRKQIWIISAAVAVGFFAAAGIFLEQRKDRTGLEKSEEQSEINNSELIKTTAMYVPYGENSYVMVDQENGTVFTVRMPTQIYDIDGNKIAEEELERGNILNIYGNGIMLESYPGQYPEVDKIEIVKNGSDADADQYQNLIDEIYQDPDPAQIPFLDVEYRTELATVTAAASSGGYAWTYTGDDGETNSVVADALHVIQWKEILDITLEDPADITLLFSKKPQSVKVFRWPSDFRETFADKENMPDGEEVPAEESGQDYVLKAAEPGFIYRISAEWENGRAEYGFVTK